MVERVPAKRVGARKAGKRAPEKRPAAKETVAQKERKRTGIDTVLGILNRRRKGVAEMRIANDIPQVVAIVKVTGSGETNIKKSVREHLGSDSRPLYLNVGKEVLLTTKKTARARAVVIRGKRLPLPKDIMATLKLEKGSLVAMVQRENGVALKRVEIEKRKAQWARLVDHETPHRLVRVAETNPSPEELLPELRRQHRSTKLKHDAMAFLKGRETLTAWKARQLLGAPDADDEGLKRRLIRERLAGQRNDGSWDGRVTLTARNLSELSDLGATRRHKSVRRAIDWLLSRPQSRYNPGMFFASDELIAEQAEIRDRALKQEHGARRRFNQRRALEVNLVRAGDDLVGWPCGPRITWTSALAVEALLKLGCENAERVQDALQTLTLSRWCDNAQQYGIRDRGEITLGRSAMERIEAQEQEAIRRYLYGNTEGPKTLASGDMSHAPFSLVRVACNSGPDGDEYPLWMPDLGEGCAIIMTRALASVKDKKLKKLAEGHLWRFAGTQRPPDGAFPQTKHFVCDQAMLMAIFAQYDHRVAKAAILRAIPWIVDSQNECGSWGKGPYEDVTTLAIVRALVSVTDQRLVVF